MARRKPLQWEWEYFASTIKSNGKTWLDGDDQPLSDSLKAMGDEEWELVCSVPIDSKTFTLIYKRPKPAVFDIG